MNESIKIGSVISEKLSEAIRDHISEPDYYKVANICGGAPGSLRQVVYRHYKVSTGNLKAVETLIRLGIQNAQSSEKSRQILVNAIDGCESVSLQKLNEELS